MDGLVTRTSWRAPTSTRPPGVINDLHDLHVRPTATMNFEDVEERDGEHMSI